MSFSPLQRSHWEKGGFAAGNLMGADPRVSRFTGPGGTLSYRYTFGIKPSPHTMRRGDS